MHIYFRHVPCLLLAMDRGGGRASGAPSRGYDDRGAASLAAAHRLSRGAEPDIYRQPEPRKQGPDDSLRSVTSIMAYRQAAQAARSKFSVPVMTSRATGFSHVWGREPRVGGR